MTAELRADVLPYLQELHRCQMISRRVREAVKRHPRWAYHYAYHIIKGRWPEAEAVIATDPKWASYYASRILGERWPEAEATISENPEWAYRYARDVIEGRWPEAEAAMGAASRYLKMLYAAQIVKGEWITPQGELIRPDIPERVEWTS